MPPGKKLTILITGCSPGGIGAALATAFHAAGHHVYATARSVNKLSPLSEQGIQTVSLDVTSPTSIAAAVSTVSTTLPPGSTGLDMLINNAASSYSMPIADLSIATAKAIFDTNVWAPIAVTQAFLPLLLRSTHPHGPTIVNHSSVGSVTAIPFQSAYNASKAALAMFTDTLRLELEVSFGVRVVELKTAGVSTNIIANNTTNTAGERLPKGSIYEPAREVVEQAMSQEGLKTAGYSAERWAGEVMELLVRENPPNVIWRGESAMGARIASLLPARWFMGMFKRMTKLDVVESILRQRREVK